MNQTVAGWATVFLASGLWLKFLFADLAFLWLQRPRHSGNRPSNVGSPFVVDITTLLTAKNVALSSRLENLTAFNAWSWLNNYRLFIMLVVATCAAKPLILASWHKDFAATFTGNLLLCWPYLVTVSGSVLFLQLIATNVATSLVAARLSIEPL
jgi:hypothetical protein